MGNNLGQEVASNPSWGDWSPISQLGLGQASLREGDELVGRRSVGIWIPDIQCMYVCVCVHTRHPVCVYVCVCVCMKANC